MTPEHSSGQGLFRKSVGPGKECLPVEKLEKCLADPVPAEMSHHLRECAYCRSELDLMRSFYREPDAAEQEAVSRIVDRLESPRASVPPVSRSWWREFFRNRWLSPAAVALAAILIAIAVGLQWRSSTAPRLYTSNPGEDVLRSGALTVIAPAGDLAAVPGSIQWQPVQGAREYKVRLLEVDQTELWSASASGSSLPIPPDVRAKIVPAKTLLLQVTALDDTGRQISRSELVRFRVLQNLYTR